jgi:hypothetical protein
LTLGNSRFQSTDNFICVVLYKLFGEKMSSNNFFLSKLGWNHIVISSVVGLLVLAGGSPVLHASLISNQTTSIQPNTIFEEEKWNRTFGGSNIDVGYAVRQTSDDGFIITGYTRSYGAAGHNVWLIKTDTLGYEEWNRTFGGANDDEGQSVQQTSDGGFIIAGWTKSTGAGGKDVWLIKTDSQGNEEWDHLFGGSNDDAATSVQQTTDGGFIISAYTSSFGTGSVDAWLIKTDSLGTLEWDETYGGYSSDGAWFVQQVTDGGYILTGWTYSSGPGYVGNVWLVKTDALGIQQWDQVFGGDDVDRGYCVQQTTDGGYIITGYTASVGAGLDDMLLIKTDAAGNELWSKTFGGTGRDYGYSVEQTFDGGYIIAGYTLSFGAGSEDVWVIKTDASGNELWNQTYGGLYSDEGYAVQQTTDTGYIVAGFTLSFGVGVHDVWLIKIEGAGVPPLEVDAGGPYEGFVGETIAFTGTVSGGAPPYMFLWDFGDGASSDEQSPSHVYTTAGVYEANFTVIDQVGTHASDQASVTVLFSDTTPPQVFITKPQAKSLYLGDRRVLPFPITLIIGSLGITVNATDNDSGIARVEFFIDGVSMANLTMPPYSWKWDQHTPLKFRHEISAQAYDGADNSAETSITVWKLL